jgi:hypothetical protein
MFPWLTSLSAEGLHQTWRDHGRFGPEQSRAVVTSVYVVRAFVRLRNELLANATLEKRLAHIE